jgi:hypothetical protein
MKNGSPIFAEICACPLFIRHTLQSK